MINTHPEGFRFMPTIQEADILSSLSHNFICIGKGNRRTIQKAVIYQDQILSIHLLEGNISKFEHYQSHPFVKS